MEYLRLFEQHSQYTAYTASTEIETPHVSYCRTQDEVHYDPKPPIVVVAKFNVTSTSSPTKIASGTTSFTAIEIDGVVQPSVTTGYTFNTTGEHTVKYYLKDTSIGQSAFTSCSGLTSISIPSGVTSISYSAFYDCSSLTSIVCNATTAPIIKNNTFQKIKTGGTLTVPIGSSGYNVWMQNANYYLGLYNWTKVEQ